MIIITGPGRSGTSALARLYQELGFDPGGDWLPDKRAGLEHGEFWRLNNRLAAGVRVTMLHPPKKERPGPRVRMINWRRLDPVLDEHRETLVRLARTTLVVKDPRFMWTLPIWVAAGAPIEHVVITVRGMSDMVASRHAAGHSEFDAGELRNSLTYGLGVMLATVHEHNLPHSIVRFPDFLHDPDDLYRALRFPEPVDPDHFRAVAERVFDVSQVHDWSERRA